LQRLHRATIALLCCVLMGSMLGATQGTAAQTTNLALNRPVTVSSNENATAFPPAAAVDGNTGTRWSSAFSDPQWIAVDLGSAQSIGRVVLRWEAAYGKAYQIQTSNDNAAWSTIYTTTTGDGGVDDLTVSGSGRYLRLYGTARATVYGYSLWELEVYKGAAATPTPTPAAPTPTPTSNSCTTVSNIALNKPAYAYFYEAKGEEPSKAVDGDMATRWGHLWYPSGPANAWLDVDLGSTAARITQVNISWEAALAADYQIQLSNDRSSWTTVRTVTNNTALTNNLTFSPSVTGRYLRVNMTRKGTAYGYSIFELQVNGCNGAAASYPPDPSPLSGTYTRVWSDNFDGTALNTANWAYDNNVHVNGEVQQYVSNNVSVSGGTLKLTARRETVNGYPFTSGRIFTKGLRSFTYGKVVARMKLPVGDGYWPAFWMMGDNIDAVGWPGNGELDIMENIGYSNWVSGALHGPNYWGAGSVGGRHDLPAGQTIAAWHTYAVEWDPTYIRWLIDDQVVRTVTRADVIANSGQWVYDNPKFILLNLALGGDYPHGYNNVTSPYYGLPQSTVDNIAAGGGVVEVDYVEVWQKR
jgi:beta-glucanase (GH16 family)